MSAGRRRTNRATYWVWLLGFMALIVLANLIHTNIPLGEVLILLIGVPRLHDVGRSGWWAAGVLISWEIVTFVSLVAPQLNVVSGLLAILLLALVGLLGAWPGTPGPNKFGNPPRRGVANLFAGRPTPEQDAADTFT